jgi:hypothetical protein
VTREPTFLFCVGATKAGTSWLYDHLSKHDECHFRSIKELHYFSMSQPSQFAKTLAAGREEIARLKAETNLDDDAKSRINRRLADLRDWQKVLKIRAIDLPAYTNYLTQGIGQAHLVGDITPAYSLMPAENLTALQTVGGDVRVLYLIRDPLARLWSHVRMIAQRIAPQRFADEALALLNRIIGGDLSGEGKGIVARGDYAAILPKLTRAIDPKRLLVMFYEDLISAPGVAKLSAFLGIAPSPADFERRVHRGVALALPATTTAHALAYLRPQYDYVARQFGHIPAAWRANMGEGVA